MSKQAPSTSDKTIIKRIFSQDGFIAIAPFIFVLLWSTGFIGAKYGLPYAEPFTFLFLRMCITVVVLSFMIMVFRPPLPKNWAMAGHSVVAGFLLHVCYLGGVFSAMRFGMSAGIAALIVGLQPILTTIFARAMLSEKVNLLQWFGLLLGFIGVACVVGESALAQFLQASEGASSITGSTINIAAAISITVALLGGAVGTVYQKNFGQETPLLSGTLMQYIGSATAFGILAFSFESMQIEWSGEFMLALLWLVVALSIGAVCILLYLIRISDASKVSSLMYLVPPATAIEAYFLFGERMGALAIAGLVMAALGVYLVMRKARAT